MGDQGTRRHVCSFCFFADNVQSACDKDRKELILEHGCHLGVWEKERASYVHETVLSVINVTSGLSLSCDVWVWGCSFSHCIHGRRVVSSGPWGVMPVDKWEAVPFWKLLTVYFLKKFSKMHVISFYDLGIYSFYWMINKNIKDI